MCPNARQDEAPAGTTPPRPGYRDAIVTAFYRTGRARAAATRRRAGRRG